MIGRNAKFAGKKKGLLKAARLIKAITMGVIGIQQL
jgi:hypothetical protein